MECVSAASATSTECPKSSACVELARATFEMLPLSNKAHTALPEFTCCHHRVRREFTLLLENVCDDAMSRSEPAWLCAPVAGQLDRDRAVGGHGALSSQLTTGRRGHPRAVHSVHRRPPVGFVDVGPRATSRRHRIRLQGRRNTWSPVLHGGRRRGRRLRHRQRTTYRRQRTAEVPDRSRRAPSPTSELPHTSTRNRRAVV